MFGVLFSRFTVPVSFLGRLVDGSDERLDEVLSGTVVMAWVAVGEKSEVVRGVR